MMIFKKAIARRTFLRGVGTTLALPLLDSMIPALSASTAAQTPTRLGYVYVPVGRIMEDWTPKTVGAGYELTPTLKPLAAHRDQFLVLSGLNIKAADPRPGERGGTHARPSAAYLTGVHPAPNKNLGISVDQVIARETGKHTQLSSLELGLDPAEFAGGDEAAYSGYYRSTIAWRSETTPLPTENNPRKIFERLFGDSESTGAKEMMRRVKRQRSILDSVNNRVDRLMREVGASDRYKLAEYLDAIRDVERRIQVTEKSSAAGDGADGEDQISLVRPTGIPATYTEHARLVFDLLLLSYQTDMTRVFTFMMGHEGTNRTYREIGVNDGHHSLSHHKGSGEAIDLLRTIDKFQSTLFAEFLDKMKATKEGDGSLLDHSVILFGSALSDGNYHLHNDVPALLAGGGGGRINGGRHIRYDGEPFSNLHLTVLNLLGVSKESYIRTGSDGTGTLPGIIS